jgi:RNA polymerase sigma factor (sigma-70 family)
LYQAAWGALLKVVSQLSTVHTHGETPEARVTTSGAATTRPEAVWREATAAFARWSGGEPAGLDRLVEVMTPVLWQVVRAHRLPAETAEDVLQTTWLALVRHRERIADPAAVGAWLTTTARRESWKVARTTLRDEPTDDDELARELPDAGSAEADVVRRDGERRLWEAVDRLPERCRRLLRIVAFEHRPDYQKVAADLEMPVGSIGPTRGRCLHKLRAELDGDLA